MRFEQEVNETRYFRFPKKNWPKKNRSKINFGRKKFGRKKIGRQNFWSMTFFRPKKNSTNFFFRSIFFSTNFCFDHFLGVGSFPPQISFRCIRFLSSIRVSDPFRKKNLKKVSNLENSLGILYGLSGSAR